MAHNTGGRVAVAFGNKVIFLYTEYIYIYINIEKLGWKKVFEISLKISTNYSGILIISSLWRASNSLKPLSAADFH